jgi:alkanesulfonate monooxygenase SsuD/methylene tetrahydromethanopterin reductase-like flavin-dependent oxidoreductase (luciferase family)
MPRDLHFGLILALTIRGLAVTSYEEMRRVASLAEELGFDSIWLCDHFLTLAPDAYVEDAGIAGGGGAARVEETRSMPLLECWTTLSALARDTRRLRLGTSVLCHSYRSPSVLAKMAATLDVISSGRLDLGLGAGWFESHADYPAEVADWYETMAREVMRALEQSGAEVRVASDDALWSGPRPQQVSE